MKNNENNVKGLLQNAENSFMLDLDDRVALLNGLAFSLRPFPGFIGMSTIQALELDPKSGFPDRGCVVLTETGDIKELELTLLPGPSTVGGVDQNNSLKDLDLSSEEKEWYVDRGIEVLTHILRESRNL